MQNKQKWCSVVISLVMLAVLLLAPGSTVRAAAQPAMPERPAQVSPAAWKRVMATVNRASLADTPVIYENKTITPVDIVHDDGFGSGVAIDGDTLVVGAPRQASEDGNLGMSGAAYVFDRNQGGPDNWGLVQKLRPYFSQWYGWFGSSVAISGDTILVGMYGYDISGLGLADVGRVYIFSRNNGGANIWGEVRSQSPSPLEGGANFGMSVAIDGDTAVVGAPNSSSRQGTAYIYARSQGGADNWGLVKKLTADDPSANFNFGFSVAIQADTVAVTARGWQDVSLNGAAFIFERDQGGVNAWGQVARLSPADLSPLDEFGTAVALDVDTLVVGARSAGSNTQIHSGAAYIFARNQGGSNAWGQVKKLAASNAAAEAFFGESVSLSGDLLVVGASGQLNSGGSTGTAYLFERNLGGPGNWGEAKLLISSVSTYPHAGFGMNTALDQGTAIIGALNLNKAYLFAVQPPETIYLPWITR